MLSNCRANKGQNFAQNEQKRVQVDYRKQIERGGKSVNVATRVYNLAAEMTGRYV